MWPLVHMLRRTWQCSVCIWMKHSVAPWAPTFSCTAHPQLWRVGPHNFLMLRGCTGSDSNCSARRSPSHFCEDENVSLCIWRFSDWVLVVFPPVVGVPGRHSARSQFPLHRGKHLLVLTSACSALMDPNPPSPAHSHLCVSFQEAQGSRLARPFLFIFIHSATIYSAPALRKRFARH